MKKILAAALFAAIAPAALAQTKPAPPAPMKLNSHAAQSDAQFYAQQAKLHEQDVKEHTPLCSPLAKVQAPAGACREP